MISVSQRDMCIIFSNVIKNAKEAIEVAEEGERFIHVDITQGDRNFLFIIENSMSPQNQGGKLI